MSEEARKFHQKKLKILMKEGYPLKQALAVSYSMARKKGYKIPNP
jgi:hypothetical protein